MIDRSPKLSKCSQNMNPHKGDRIICAEIDDDYLK